MADEESAFDPETYMHTDVDGVMETKYTPVPEADYESSIDTIDIRKITTDRGAAIVLDVNHIINDPVLAEKMGMERLNVRQGIFLDVEPDGRIALGPNKNVKLGRLRAAVGQNSAKAWNFSMLEGAGPLMIAVSIDGDYNRVDRTTALGEGKPGGASGGGVPRKK